MACAVCEDRMKINDIVSENQLTELNWDQIKSGTSRVAQVAKTGYNALQRGVAGAQAGIAQAKGKHQIANDVKYWFDRWNNEVVAGNPGAAQSPKVLQQFASKLASNYVKQGGRMPAVTSMAPADVKSYLQQVIGLDASAAAGGFIKQPKQKTQTTGKTQPATTSQTIPTQTAAPTQTSTETLPQQPTQVPPQSDIEQQALAAGIQIKSQEPIIIATGKGKEYGLGDNGQWVHLASGKVPPESFQQFLSQQHDISLGVGQNQPTDINGNQI